MRTGVATASAFAGALVLVLPGCGGSASLYSSARARECFDSARVRVMAERQDTDILAQKAQAAWNVSVDGTTATISFSRTREDAKRMEASYRVFAKAFETPVDDVLTAKGNVVILWDRTPSDAERARLEGCLLTQ